MKCKTLVRWGVAAGLAVLLSSSGAMVKGAPYINEVLYKLGGGDAPWEYVELRGTANQSLANVYLVAIEGDSGAAATVGDVREVFSLTGKSLGSNGFALLLQNGNGYTVNASANTYTNSGSDGFGSGATSTIGHSGDSDITNISNPSVTFMLIQSATAPTLLNDIDSNDDGTPDGSVYNGWTVLDAVGILDNTANSTDKAYGLINFRNSGGTGTGPNLVDTAFTADYVGRVGNSTGSAAADWVAGNVKGDGPAFSLGNTAVSQASLAGAALDHLGSANPVPEPALAGCITLAGLALIRRTRR